MIPQLKTVDPCYMCKKKVQESMSYFLDQTDVKYLALFYKTAYLSAMSIRSDYRAVTECIAKAFSIFRFNQSKMHSEQKRLSDI